MDSDVLTRSFEGIGARLQIVPAIGPIGKSPRLMVHGNRMPPEGFSVEAKRDHRGSFFEIRTNGSVEFSTAEGPKDSNTIFLFAETKKGSYQFSCGRLGGVCTVYAFPKLLGKIK